MSTRSYSDVPNRIINLFLQEAGERYDRARGLAPYRRMTPETLARFDGLCAYCSAPWEVEEHLVPRNRRAGGLHAWGNVVPACKSCNQRKGDRSWEAHLREVVIDPEKFEAARARIARYISEFAYDPDTSALLPILAALYERSDHQARELVRTALVETEPLLRALKRPARSVQEAAAPASVSDSPETDGPLISPARGVTNHV